MPSNSGSVGSSSSHPGGENTDGAARAESVFETICSMLIDGLFLSVMSVPVHWRGDKVERDGFFISSAGIRVIGAGAGDAVQRQNAFRGGAQNPVIILTKMCDARRRICVN